MASGVMGTPKLWKGPAYRYYVCGGFFDSRIESYNWEFGISRCKLLYIGWINNKVLLYSTGNYIQYLVMNPNGKEYKKGCVYMYN